MRYLTVLVIGSLLAGLPVLAASSRNPEDILGSLESAYGAGDVEALRALMAPDYEFESAEGTELSAKQELEALEKLFDVSHVTLTFSRDFELHRTTAGKESWVLRDVPAHLKVEEKAGAAYDVDVRVTLFLRRDPETGGVWIFRWREEPKKTDD